MFDKILGKIEITEEMKDRLEYIDEEVNRIFGFLKECDEKYVRHLLITALYFDMRSSFKIENLDDYLVDYLLNSSDKISLLELNKALYNNKMKISKDMIKKTHGQLMNYEDEKKQSGEFRKKAVYIGVPGEKPLFTPLDSDKLDWYLDEFVNFFNSCEKNDMRYHPVIKSAIIHYVFVYIHPFVDGNGRISRILQTASMWKDEGYRIDCIYPLILLSQGFEKNKEKYFELENMLHKDFENKNAWENWLNFNLEVTENHLFNMGNNIKITYNAHLKLKDNKSWDKSK